MNLPTAEAVRQLARTDERDCLSLFMPTYESGREVQQNAIRFENLLKQAREKISETDLASRLDELQPLVEDDEFWQHQSAGLAVLADSESVELYRVPRRLSERVVVGKGFDLLPLLPVLQGNGVFHIVVVSKNESRLLVATATDVSKYPADLPEGIDDVPGGHHHKGFGLHSFRVRPRSGDSAVPHGHVEADERERQLRYLREIDDRVEQVIGDRDATLLFAGDEGVFAQFKEVTEQRGLVGERIPGNHDDHSPQEIHERAMPIVEKVFAERTDEAVARWQQARSGNLVLEELEPIAAAAERGQVALLLFDQDELLDRAVGQQVSEEDRHRHRAAARAVGHVLATDGQVFAAPSDKMEGYHIVAVLRYAMDRDA